jgi:hypothetical protein
MITIIPFKDRSGQYVENNYWIICDNPEMVGVLIKVNDQSIFQRFNLIQTHLKFSRRDCLFDASKYLPLKKFGIEEMTRTDLNVWLEKRRQERERNNQ